MRNLNKIQDETLGSFLDVRVCAFNAGQHQGLGSINTAVQDSKEVHVGRWPKCIAKVTDCRSY